MKRKIPNIAFLMSKALFIEEVLIPKSRNSGNYQDYIYLDALNYGHGELLSFEKRYVPKKEKTEFFNKYQINGKYMFFVFFL